METFLQKKEEKKGINKVFLISLAAAALLIASAIWLVSLQPSPEEKKQKELQGAFLEGTPEFEQYTNNIIISTDADRTTESPIGLGTISMSIQSDIRNKGDKTINGLEVKVGVVDRAGKVIKEKKTMVVPNQKEKLEPKETMHIAVPLDGFRKEDERANVRWKVTAIRFE